MRVALVTIAYNQPDGVSRLAETAISVNHEIEMHLFLHSKHEPTVKACESLAKLPSVTYYSYGVNHGVAASWNEGMLNAYGSGADIVLIVNDDVCFSNGDVDKLAARAIEHRDAYMISCAGFHAGYKRWMASHGYSCFVINPIAIEKIGCFDENIFPAYCEDQDYAHRARLAGLAEENCPDTMICHAGSSTIYSSEELRRQNAVTQGRNLQYYRHKWGGDGGSERFSSSFNDPAFGYYIPPHQRSAPYGDRYDRHDRDIVKL